MAVTGPGGVLGSSEDVLFLVKWWASWSTKKGNLQWKTRRCLCAKAATSAQGRG